MEFRFTEEELAFRGQIIEFLETELPEGWDSDEEVSHLDAVDAWGMSKAFQRKLAERGWLTLAWPKEYGGLGAPIMHQVIFNERMAYQRAPGRANMGVGWIGPALMIYGDERQRRRYLPRIADAEDFWCTLFSEPDAGSDLASLTTRAVRSGDDFVVDGLKVWTSVAHQSDFGLLAARTDPDAPKHKGISLFILDMRSPGIEILPLVNMADQHRFNQVMLNRVRVPGENLVGELHRGWYQMAVSLDFERSSIGSAAGSRRFLDDLVALVKTAPPAVDRGRCRILLADLFIQVEIGTLLSYRVANAQSRGEPITYQASVAKLFNSETAQRIARSCLGIFGLYGQVGPGSSSAVARGKLERNYLSSVALTIGGGTSEVLRNVIATRGLGLPR